MAIVSLKLEQLLEMTGRETRKLHSPSCDQLEKSLAEAKKTRHLDERRRETKKNFGRQVPFGTP